MRATRRSAVGIALAMLWACLAPHSGAQDPGWAVNPAAFQFNMNVTTSTYVDGVRADNMNDVLAAFVGDEVRGVAEPILVSDQPVYFLTIHSNANGERVTFRVYDAAADVVREGSQQIAFLSNAVLGAPGQPYRVDFGEDPAVTDPSTWGVDPAGFGLTMTATIQVGIDGEELTDPDALAAAFVGSEVRGTATATILGNGKLQASSLFFLTVYSNTVGESITLRVSSPARDTVYVFENVFTFEADAVLGTPEGPFLAGSPIVTSNDVDFRLQEGLSMEVYPNPSAGAVQIRYGAPAGMPVGLRVYDVLGRLVAQRDVTASAHDGPQRIAWQPVADSGLRLVAGVYFLRLEGGGKTVTRTLAISR